MSLLVPELQAHLDKIADTFGCVMQQRKDTPGMMYVEEKPPRIAGPALDYECATARIYPDVCARYYTMLHELGHVARGHTQGRPPYVDETWYFDNGVLRSEAEAWDFALCNALVKPTPEAAYFMRHVCIGSYWAGARSSQGRNDCRLYNGNRHHVAFKYDEPDHFFHAVIDKMDSFIEGR